MNNKQKLKEILLICEAYGGTDGSNHKQYALDQIVRIITGDQYKYWREGYEEWNDDRTDFQYWWDDGVT